eukprot:TRINITY_DN9229_c0_g3_i1.p1 TRINITY_DN9229_c0_g3~~TRINITY_DN9229_c0_g3_i1.p1  ORF type:complete len:213 (-),score=38.03 TRINITY_DN9229_c0_g3_i1:23-661(-)
MPRRRIVHCESKSLWNYTLSPGWTQEEVQVLKKALQRFGVGRWKKIINSRCLPGKTIGQIYMQTQRLLGQQSLGEFMGLHLDLESVFRDNMSKRGVLRKNNCIINTGDNPTREERMRRIEENRKRYGLDIETIRSIRLPRFASNHQRVYMLEELESDKFTTVEKLEHLMALRKTIEAKLGKLESLPEEEAEAPALILTVKRLASGRWKLLKS